MARPIPYNQLAIPRPAPSLEAIYPFYEQMRRVHLPGIIIPEAGNDEASALTTLNPILTRLGVSIHRTMPPIVHQNGQGDQPLHIDAIPDADPTIGAVLQFTGKDSAADIVFARLADPFCSVLTARNAGIANPMDMDYALPDGTEALLDEGLVDPEVLDPTAVYVGSVATGDATWFAFGGRNPLAHRFRTTTPQRYAQGFIVPFTLS